MGVLYARTPQQNGVAERKNKTLIEAARTMLADLLLPTAFWAKAVSTACYVQNRVLVTKPHNKTPYELLLSRPPSISFIRPFGCPVTILNTLDPLGKFDRKADEGFFVGYFINSKAFTVFNTKTRKVEENLHINFLENKPNVVGTGPDWLVDIDLLTNSMNYEPLTVGNQTNKNAGIKDNVDAVPTQQYILLPLLYDSPQSSKDTVIDDAGYANSINKDSTVSPSVSTAGQSFTNTDDLPTDPLMPNLEDTTDLLNTGIFSGAYDDENMGAEANINNLETTMNVMQRDDGIFISQDKYVAAHILKKFDFVTMKTASTPIETNKALLKDKEAEDVDVHLYRSMIGSLMYLTAFRPDIICLKGQPKLGLWYPKDSPFDLETFSNSDYAGASLDRKSTIEVLWIQNQMLDYRKAKRTTEISQSSGPIPLVIDETVIQEWEDKMERVATTASSLEVEHDSGNINRTESMTTLNESFPQGTNSGSGPRCQDTILGVAEAQTRFEAASKQSNDPPLSRVNTLGSREDNMKLTKLMEFYTKLSERALDL
ncbi:retrovirus-related pol polyprotein from transposon TNT 1-94 [Tanacetum coccineum]